MLRPEGSPCRDVALQYCNEYRRNISRNIAGIYQGILQEYIKAYCRNISRNTAGIPQGESFGKAGLEAHLPWVLYPLAPRALQALGFNETTVHIHIYVYTYVYVYVYIRCGGASGGRRPIWRRSSSTPRACPGPPPPAGERPLSSKGSQREGIVLSLLHDGLIHPQGVPSSARRSRTQKGAAAVERVQMWIRGRHPPGRRFVHEVKPSRARQDTWHPATAEEPGPRRFWGGGLYGPEC